MTKDELVKIIEVVVAREIKKQFPVLLTEILSSGRDDDQKQTPNDTQTTNKTKTIIKTPIIKSIVKTEKKFSSNPILNEILNQTEGFTSEHRDPQSLMENADFNQPMVMTDTRGQPVDIKQLPPELSTALTKDYSELLKKTNKIVQSKRPI